MAAPAVVLAGLALSGCASINGMQDNITAADVAPQRFLCPTTDQLKTFNEMLDGTAKRDYRDGVITNCIQAIDGKYREFRSALRSDSVTSNLVTDVLGLGFGAGAALAAKPTTAKQFTQAALAVTGIGSAINKDVFFKQTLPAIEAVMDKNRADVLTGIVKKQKDDTQGKDYTLAAAGIDLLAYQNAGDIDSAIATLTQAASNGADKAKQSLDFQQDRAYRAAPLKPDIQTREYAVTDKVWAFTEAADQTKLTTLGSALGVKQAAGESFDDFRVDILDKIDAMLSAKGADQDAVMTGIETSYTHAIQ